MSKEAILKTICDTEQALSTTEMEYGDFHGNVKAICAFARRMVNETRDPDLSELRDELAGKAMQAMLGSPIEEISVECHRNEDKCSEWAYSQADAMIKARDK